jgi:RNA polymerase sigma factor (sigma-70 family)
MAYIDTDPTLHAADTEDSVPKALKYEEMFKKHFDLLVYEAKSPRYGMDNARAEDIAQTVFLKAFNKFGVDKEFFPGWLYTALRTTVLDDVRYAKNRHSYGVMASEEEIVVYNQGHADPDVAVNFEAFEDDDTMKRLMGRVTLAVGKKRSDVIALRILGYQFNEIGELLEIAENTAKTRVFRAAKLVDNDKELRALLGRQ